MQTINKGSIYHNTKWIDIFNYLTTKNPYKSFWIEKVYINSENLLDNDKKFSHYQLKCEEGFYNKIPKKFNDFIKQTFKDERYITELKEF